MTSMRSERGLTLVELLVTSLVMITVLGITTGLLVNASTMFTQQRTALEGRNSGAASLDMLTRLLRQSACVIATTVRCNSITPDPDNNGIFDSVRVQADWNPRNGVLTDPYEDVFFTVAADVVTGRMVLWKREPADAALVAFGDGVLSLRFVYTNQNGGALPNVVAQPDLIGGVAMTVVTEAARGLPAVTTTTAISLRRVK